MQEQRLKLTTGLKTVQRASPPLTKGRKGTSPRNQVELWMFNYRATRAKRKDEDECFVI
jgi:hypothetical protein